MNKRTKGIILGIIVGLAWGLDSTLMGVVGQDKIFEGFASSPLVSAFFHDSFAFFWIALTLLFSHQLKGSFELLKTKKEKLQIGRAHV